MRYALRLPLRAPGSCAVSAAGWMIEDVAGREVPHADLARAMGTTLFGTRVCDIETTLETYGVPVVTRFESLAVVVDSAPAILACHAVVDGEVEWPDEDEFEAIADAVALGFDADSAAEARLASQQRHGPRGHAVYLRCTDGERRQVVDPVGGHGWIPRERLLRRMDVVPCTVEKSTWFAMAYRSVVHLARRLEFCDATVTELLAGVGELQRLAQVEASLEYVDHLVCVGAIDSPGERKRLLERLLRRVPARCERRHRWSLVRHDGAEVEAVGLHILVPTERGAPSANLVPETATFAASGTIKESPA